MSRSTSMSIASSPPSPEEERHASQSSQFVAGIAGAALSLEAPRLDARDDEARFGNAQNECSDGWAGACVASDVFPRFWNAGGGRFSGLALEGCCCAE
ncbi:hypothetical protein PVAG01_09804 [Phlyctema vagabunda]|uniref:Uncharacterized protein n=1 Tax=Phlyctema vagabunda TaxID=108571 RepID=A0ABR4P458_9HELO